ncbi:hypothetical protein ALC60_04973, partial [Trachymyrmex zeteki]
APSRLRTAYIAPPAYSRLSRATRLYKVCKRHPSPNCYQKWQVQVVRLPCPSRLGIVPLHHPPSRNFLSRAVDPTNLDPHCHSTLYHRLCHPYYHSLWQVYGCSMNAHRRCLILALASKNTVLRIIVQLQATQSIVKPNFVTDLEGNLTTMRIVRDLLRRYLTQGLTLLL